MVLIKRDNSNNKLHPYNFRGNIERYIANTDLSAGQPVCYTVEVSNNCIFTADSINTNHTYDNFLGICVLDVSGGEWASILTSGITHVNRIITYGRGTSEPTTAPILRKLDDDTSGNTYTDTYIKFTDSDVGGDTPGHYSTNKKYSIKFDAGINNTWIMKIVNLKFEHISYLYDRLLLWESDDDTTYAKSDLNGWQACSIPTSDLDYGSSSKSTSQPKNVAPKSQTTTTTFPINKRFLRWNFFSDGSKTEPGWEIYLWVPQPSGIIDGTIGNNVYIDTSGNVSDNINYSFFEEPIGKVVSTDTSGNRIKIFIK